MNERARLPQKTTTNSVGLDLFSTHHMEIEPGHYKIISTGIGIELPEGYYGWVASRSGLASRGIVVQGGIIDPDYTGEIKVILYNHSPTIFVAHEGDRVAQLILQKYLSQPYLISRVGPRRETERGENGFGSTENNMNPEDDSDCLFCGA